MSANARRVPESAGGDDALTEARDRAWLARLRQDDITAFEEMFRTYGNSLYGFIYSFVRSPEEAQELVQDLFCWIWEHRRDWEVTRTVRTYLIQAARNRAITRLTRHATEKRFIERLAQLGASEEAAHSPVKADHEVQAHELERAIDEAIVALPERCRQVFLLNRQQRLSYAQIAIVLGISVKTVEIHMGRALAALRKRLADWVP